MSLLEVNGNLAIAGTIFMPRIGAWTAELAIDERGLLFSGPATISAAGGKATFVGSFYRGGEFRGTSLVRIVGGAGHLNDALPGKSYYKPTAGLVLQDILNAAGEKLAPSSSPAILTTAFDAWSRQAGTTGEQIKALADATGGTWRVLDDGTIWVGKETWASSGLNPDTLEADPQAGAQRFWGEVPTLRPGTTLGGQRVGKVEHRFEEHIRTTAWTDDGDTLGDDVLTAVRAIIRHEVSGLDLYAVRAARVIGQNADGTLELVPDDPRFGPGLSKVAVGAGVAGGSSTITSGRVFFIFADGDPRKPRVVAWEAATVSQNVVPGTTVLLGSAAAAQALALATATKADLDAIQSKFDAHTHSYVNVTTPATTSVTTTLIGPLGAIASTVVKADA